jgi:hypothetical protein
MSLLEHQAEIHPLQHTTKPTVSTMDEYDSYLDSLAGEWLLPLRGNLPGNSDQDHYDKQRGRATAFATTSPDFNVGNGPRSYRTRSSNHTGGTQSSRFRHQQDYEDPREKYWKNNHSVSKHEKIGGQS